MASTRGVGKKGTKAVAVAATLKKEKKPKKPLGQAKDDHLADLKYSSREGCKLKKTRKYQDSSEKKQKRMLAENKAKAEKEIQAKRADRRVAEAAKAKGVEEEEDMDMDLDIEEDEEMGAEMDNDEEEIEPMSLHQAIFAAANLAAPGFNSYQQLLALQSETRLLLEQMFGQ